MKQNIGMTDKMIRYLVAIVFIVIGFTVSPWWFIVAAIALFTAVVGWCGLYDVLKITSLKPTPSPKSRKKR